MYIKKQKQFNKKLQYYHKQIKMSKQKQINLFYKNILIYYFNYLVIAM